MADLPPGARRSGLRETLAASLRRNRAEDYRRAAEHVDAATGYRDPAPALFASWQKNASSWALALDPGMDAIGLAVVRSSDDWTILVVVLVDDPVLLTDTRPLEESAIQAVNRVRGENGLRALRELRDLSAVARAHSEDMVARGFFDHVDPQGRLPSDRVKAAEITYRLLAENIQYDLNVDDPVENAVASWMESPGHRGNILTGEYTHTGMGVASDGKGGFYFTQLFLIPPR